MIKSCNALVKAVGTADGLAAEGQFTAYASVFDNVDSYGEVVVKGAFADTLDEWSASGDPIPLYWAHLMSADPEMNLGEVLTAEEDDHGLLVTAQLDLDNPKAAYVHRLMKGRRVKQMSFAYDVEDAGPAKVGDQDVVELRRLKLHEVSVVPIGANQETDVLAVKAGIADLLSGAKAGKVISAKNLESLRSARDSIDAVIRAADSSADDDQDKAAGNGPGHDEGAPAGGVKSVPTRTPSADLLGATLTLLALEAP